MSKYIGHTSGQFNAGHELWNKIFLNSNARAKKITKIGIQLERGKYVLLNDVQFEIGKNERLQLDDVEITSIKVLHKDKADIKKISVILDYEYTDVE